MNRPADTHPLIAIDRSARMPLRSQIECALRSAIASGRLAEGALVPATRRLASELGVSRGVVVEAYEELIAEGRLEARRGSATRVAVRFTGASPARHRDGLAL